MQGAVAASSRSRRAHLRNTVVSTCPLAHVIWWLSAYKRHPLLPPHSLPLTHSCSLILSRSVLELIAAEKAAAVETPSPPHLGRTSHANELRRVVSIMPVPSPSSFSLTAHR